jgi:hypothetical protein
MFVCYHLAARLKRLTALRLTALITTQKFFSGLASSGGIPFAYVLLEC